MPESRTAERPRVTVTSWDFIKDNYDPDDRLAVVIKNQDKDRVIQRIDTARNIASPDFQKWLRFQNVMEDDVYLTTNTLRPEATGQDPIRHSRHPSRIPRHRRGRPCSS